MTDVVMFIFPTTSYRAFTQKLAKQARLKVGRVEIKKFSDGEIYVKVGDKVAWKKVYVVGTTAPSANNFVELLLLINALRTSRARYITAIIPYFGYGRADHIVAQGEALSAKLMADLLKCAGVNRVITVDLHSPKVEKFFKVPLTQVRAQELLAYAVKAELLPAAPQYQSRRSVRGRQHKSSALKPVLVVVAPDHGALPLAQRMALALHASVAWFEKVRPQHNVVKIGALYGDVGGRHAIIVDDMIDTAGTIVAAAGKLKEYGARSIIVAATHDILSGPALVRLQKAPIARVIVTNTIPTVHTQTLRKLKILSIIPLLAKQIP